MTHNRRLINWFIQHDKKDEPKSMLELIQVNFKSETSDDTSDEPDFYEDEEL